ncbi:hypothetical protein GGR57DRAFT_498644 [Xylariaceae sp. FL1272]|nr:hypothetical protein GGR57DRAFT_498644 [Xylariaceae sp. FL1272]
MVIPDQYKPRRAVHQLQVRSCNREAGTANWPSNRNILTEDSAADDELDNSGREEGDEYATNDDDDATNAKNDSEEVSNGTDHSAGSDEDEEDDDDDGSDASEGEESCNEDYCECEERYHSFCKYHCSMIDKVYKSRNALLEAEKAGRKAPKLTLDLPVDPIAVDVGHIPESMREWFPEKGQYRLYLDRDSLEPSAEDEKGLGRYIDFVWTARGWRKKDWISGVLRMNDDDEEEEYCLEPLKGHIQQFACPLVASTQPIEPDYGVEIIFLSEDHIQVELGQGKAWIRGYAPRYAPGRLRFVGVLQEPF